MMKPQWDGFWRARLSDFVIGILVSVIYFYLWLAIPNEYNATNRKPKADAKGAAVTGLLYRLNKRIA